MGVDRCFILVRLSQSDSLNRGVSVMFTWDSDLATEAEWAEFVQQLSSKKLWPAPIPSFNQLSTLILAVSTMIF
jgi:hypothetical protein